MGDSVGTVSVPPRPKSPPEYPDLYGKRRVLAKVQILEREISFLEVSWNLDAMYFNFYFFFVISSSNSLA